MPQAFEELIYACNEVETIILDKWPNAKITDASDCIHEDRFEVSIDHVTEEQFYLFAMEKSFAGDCFKLLLMSQSPDQEQREKVKILIEKHELSAV